MSVTTEPARMIDSQPQLDELCDRIASMSDNAIACDTEFVRTQTYRPHLCVVQLGVDGRQSAIDLVAELDTSRLIEQLMTGPQTKIFHAAKQDFEAFFSVYGVLPNTVFDTQIAAGLLGFQPQIGYAGICKELLGIDVPKDQTRTDWSRRPLTDAQIKYALDDVAHLNKIFSIVSDRLESAGRTEWAREDCAALLDTSLYFLPAENAWHRLASIPFLPVDVQARARQLAGWREDRAREFNRPRQWIISDKALLGIAHANPAAAGDMSGLEDLPASTVKKRGAEICALLATTNADYVAGRLALRQEPVPIPPDKKLVKHLSGIVRGVAESLTMAPEILATRKDLTGILNGREDLRALRGWRREVIGEILLAAV